MTCQTAQTLQEIETLIESLLSKIFQDARALAEHFCQGDERCLNSLKSADALAPALRERYVKLAAFGAVYAKLLDKLFSMLMSYEGNELSDITNTYILVLMATTNLLAAQYVLRPIAKKLLDTVGATPIAATLVSVIARIEEALGVLASLQNMLEESYRAAEQKGQSENTHPPSII